MLKVTTRDLGNEVEIRVRDNGTGIAPEFREKLFQPFFTTKPTGEGTGLGLSISWDIVTQQHRGTIVVDSRVGEFTEFTIRLPRRLHPNPPRLRGRLEWGLRAASTQSAETPPEAELAKPSVWNSHRRGSMSTWRSFANIAFLVPIHAVATKHQYSGRGWA